MSNPEENYIDVGDLEIRIQALLEADPSNRNLKVLLTDKELGFSALCVGTDTHIAASDTDDSFFALLGGPNG